MLLSVVAIKVAGGSVRVRRGSAGCGVAQTRVRRGSDLGCGGTQTEARRLAVWQARVRISARHPREGFYRAEAMRRSRVTLDVVLYIKYC